MEKNKTIKLLVIIALVFVISAGLLFYYTNYLQSYTLRGRVFDSDNNAPISKNVVLKCGETVISPNSNGEFSINNYSKRVCSHIEVSSSSLYLPIKIFVGSRKFIEIPIQYGLETFLEQFTHSLKSNLFRNNYKMIDNAMVEKITEESFLDQANNWYLDNKKNNREILNITFSVKDKEHYYSEISKNSYNEVVCVEIVFEIETNNDTDFIQRNAYFIKKDSDWSWLYENDFFAI